MTVGSALRWAQKELEETAGEDAPADARLFVCEASGITHDRILMNLGQPLQGRQEGALREMVRRRNEHEPAQYIVGSAQFLGLMFKCDPRALIPRFDTEMLALIALQTLAGEGTRRALDLCTGSGCLAVTLALSGADVTASDFSEDALMLAQENARRHGAKITFCQGDLFDALPEGSLFDMIVSNPPYVRSEEMDELMPEVRAHEPHIALDGGRDGLDFFRRFARETHFYLRPGGVLLLEMGDGQADEVRALFEEMYEGIEIVQDMRGVDRVFKARLRREHAGETCIHCGEI